MMETTITPILNLVAALCFSFMAKPNPTIEIIIAKRGKKKNATNPTYPRIIPILPVGVSLGAGAGAVPPGVARGIGEYCLVCCDNASAGGGVTPCGLASAGGGVVRGIDDGLLTGDNDRIL